MTVDQSKSAILKIFNDGTFAVFHQTDFIDIIKIIFFD